MKLEKLRVYYKWYKLIYSVPTMLFIVLTPSIVNRVFNLNSVALLSISLLLTLIAGISKTNILNWLEKQTNMLIINNNLQIEVDKDGYFVQCPSGLDWRYYEERIIRNSGINILESGKIYFRSTGPGEIHNPFRINLYFVSTENRTYPNAKITEFFINISYCSETKILTITKSRTFLNANGIILGIDKDTPLVYPEVKSLLDASNILLYDPEALGWESIRLESNLNFLTDVLFKFPRIAQTIQNSSESIPKIKLI